MHRSIQKLATFALGLLTLTLAPALSASAQISCEPPQLSFQDSDGKWFCAASEPNLSCYEDVPPYYDEDSNEWSCPSIEQAKKILARLAGPQVSCASEALGDTAVWNESFGAWECPPAPTACSLCENRFELCKSDVAIAKDKCVKRGRVVARTMCTGDGAVNWRGELVDTSGMTCTESFVYDPRTGSKRRVKNCTGGAIDGCITGYIESHPGEAVATNVGGKVGVSGTVKGKAGIPLVAEGEVSVTGSTELSTGRAWTSNWGGGVGIGQACGDAARKAADGSCEPCSDVCEE